MLYNQTIGILDKMLLILAKEIGEAIPGTLLLKEAGWEGEPSVGYFFLRILHSDGLLEPIKHPTGDMGLMIVTLSPKGFSKLTAA